MTTSAQANPIRAAGAADATGPASRPDPELRDPASGPHAAPDVAAPRPRCRLGLVLVVGLAALTVLLTTRQINKGGFRFSDASRHAMDGVFIHDFVADLPGSAHHPIEYGLKYYAHYPCLGIGLYYPPFFAAVEAVFFGIFGVSAVTARATVVAFAVLGVAALYLFMRRFTDRTAAALAAALFVALPSVVWWGRMVMLEVPTATMVILATLFFYRYVEERQRYCALWTGLLVVAAVMSKQTAVFIVPAFFVYLLVRKRWGAFRDWPFLVGIVFVIATLGPYFYLTFKHAHYLTARASLGGSLTRDAFWPVLWGKLTFVLRGWAECLVHQGMDDAATARWRWLGWVGLATTGLALAACVVWELVRPGVKATWLLVAMVVFFLAESVYLRAGGARYPIIIMPVLAGFLPLLLWRMRMLQWRRLLVPAMTGVLTLAGLSYAQAVPYRKGHAEAARQMVTLLAGKGQFILFDGHWDGDIVFYVRKHDPQRKIYMLRGNKMLNAYASFPQYGYRDLIVDEDKLIEFLTEFDIYIVALEEKMLVETRAGKALRQAVKNTTYFPPIRREEEDEAKKRLYPVDAPGTRLNGTDIAIYSANYAGHGWADELEIPLVGLGRAIRVPLTTDAPPVIVDLPDPEPALTTKPAPSSAPAERTGLTGQAPSSGTGS